MVWLRRVINTMSTDKSDAKMSLSKKVPFAPCMLSESAIVRWCGALVCMGERVVVGNGSYGGE